MGKGGRINWGEVIEKAWEVAKEYNEKYNTSLTLRGLFYQLVSFQIQKAPTRVYQGFYQECATEEYFLGISLKTKPDPPTGLRNMSITQQNH